VAGGIGWQTAVADAGRWVGAASVPADLPELDGHFPGAPIVPGVAQLGWAAQCARQVFGLASLSGTLEAVKFRRPIRPGAIIRLELRLDAPASKVHLTLSDDDHTYCTGRLVIA
jgi:3-hydroxymyristoyl/3-hydroxydecanoyl-(acyl carrier protein) dehydratase